MNDSRSPSRAPAVATAKRGFLRRLGGGLLPLAVLAGSALVAILMTLNKPPLKEETPRVQGIPVEVAEIRKKGRRVQVHSQGTVRPAVTTMLASEVPGRVVEVSENFVVGGFFKKGEILLRLDDRDFRARVTQAEAALASAQSRLALERGRAQSAYRDWLGLNSDNRDSEATELALRKPQLAEAEAQLKSAQAQLEEARLDLERTVIRAPYNGLLHERIANIGQFMGVGKELGLIYATDSAEVRLSLPESRLGYIRLPGPGSAARPAVSLQADSGDKKLRWQARLVRTEGALDEKSRTLSVIARVNDPYGLNRRNPEYEPLRFGAFVRAVIDGRHFPGLITLPNSLLRAGGKIWVVDKDDRLQNRSVSVLQTRGEQMYITAGLREDDRVCLTPLGNVLPGTPARIIKGPSAGSGVRRAAADAVRSRDARRRGTKNSRGGGPGNAGKAGNADDAATGGLPGAGDSL